MSKAYTYTNESFSGCDMVATILIPSLGNTPYAIGELQTISYSIHMDRQPVRSIGDINVKDYVMGPRTIAGSLVFAVFNKHFANRILKDVSNSVSSGYSFLIDEIPPFNIVISAANEYGVRSKMVIYGVRLVNEGQVMSINDIYTENTYQFVATDIEYLNTDDSSTSSSNSGNNLNVIGSTKTESIVENVQINNQVSNTEPELKYSILTSATKTRKGTIELWINPNQEEGYIYVNGPKFYAAIDVKTGLNSNKKIKLSLKEGEYQAYWSSTISKSNVITFSMPLIIDDSSIDKAAPLIEKVTEDSITILSNVAEHTKVIYMDEDKTKYSVKLSGKRATISNLRSGHKYKIATCNSELEDYSKYTKATTLEFGHDEFKNFLDYLHYNKHYLDNTNFDLYLQVVTEGKEAMYNGAKCNTIADSFVVIKKTYNNILNNLKTEDFNGELEYQAEVNRLTDLIAVCTEIIILATNINNDSIYGYNYEVMVVEPPVSESGDFCTNTFVVQENIKALDFYKNNNSILQFVRNITRNDFKTINNEIICYFNGRPNTSHNTYAINEYGYKSPRVDFYTLSYEERILALNKFKENTESIQYELSRAKNLYGSYIDETLSDKEEIRVLSEITKTPVRKNVKTPEIIETTNTYATIKLEETNNDFMVSISDINNALLDTPRYKIEADGLIEFSIEKHGLKPGNEYMIWVEHDGIQISHPTTFTLSNKSEDLEIKEYQVQKYFFNELAQELKDALKEKNLYCNLLESLIDKNVNELSSNKANLLENILNDIIDESSALTNFKDILYCFFVIYMEHFYTIDSDFFEDAVKIHNSLNTIQIPNDCIVSIFEINSDGLTQELLTVKEHEVIDLNARSGQYFIIQFIENDFTNRSGFIFVNNLINTYSTHKIQVEVGE